MRQRVVCVWVAACSVGLALDAPRAEVDVAALIRQLESAEANERDAATEQLSKLEVTKPPVELLAALESTNSEVRVRAQKAVWAIRTRAALPTLPRGKKFAERGEIDLFVAATATWDLKPDDDRLWVTPFEVGAKAFAKAGMIGDRRPSYPGVGGDFQRYRSNIKLRFIRTDEVYSRPEKGPDGKPLIVSYEAVHSPGVDNPRSLNGLVVSRGSVRAKGPIDSTLILATGDVTAGNDIHDSVVICDGDVTVGRNMNLCIIVARGKITVVGAATASNLYSGKTVTVGKPFSPVEGLEVLVSENEPKTFGYITFFELSRVGLSVKAADAAVTVATVASGSACDKAGLRTGDVILDVNGKKPTDPESLRRLLRDALAVGDATVKLKRGNDTLTVKVALPE